METDLKQKIARLPQAPGVYKFLGRDGNLLYVGKSVSIKKRVQSYFSGKNLGPKTDLLVSRISSVDFVKVFSEFEALLLEAELIRTHKPFFNIVAKDDKSPIYIKISKSPIPLVSTTRKPNIQKGDFIRGPFPSGKTTKEILRIIRRIFPYCHHKNAKKPCLFVHLGLCPYPWGSPESQVGYQKTVAKIKKLLNGKNKDLIRQLKTEMAVFSKDLDYENADVAKKQLEKLEYLGRTHHAPEEFLKTPTLVDDQTRERLESLASALGLTRLPKRIECYDISNISGKNAAGSMVVFTAGRPDKAEYRRFKIKFLDTPNDFEMLREVLGRRFQNNWPKPDLLIIDGGKGQLNAALSAAVKHKITVHIVSLAKRFEEIYTPDNVLPISLPAGSPGRLLAQEIRDEAHRFAITYHRLLRSKSFIKA